MGRADRPSTHHGRPCGVPKPLQVRENLVAAESAEARNILNEYPTGSEPGDNAAHLEPEARPRGRVLGSESLPLAGGGHVLTGESAGEEVESSGLDPKRSKRLGCDGMYVLEDGHAGPVLGNDPATEGIYFAEAHRPVGPRVAGREREARDP